MNLLKQPRQLHSYALALQSRPHTGRAVACASGIHPPASLLALAAPTLSHAKTCTHKSMFIETPEPETDLDSEARTMNDTAHPSFAKRKDKHDT